MKKIKRYIIPFLVLAALALYYSFPTPQRAARVLSKLTQYGEYLRRQEQAEQQNHKQISQKNIHSRYQSEQTYSHQIGV